MLNRCVARSGTCGEIGKGGDLEEVELRELFYQHFRFDLLRGRFLFSWKPQVALFAPPVG